MKSPPLRNALLACALALFFSWAFFYLKHNPLLRNIIPFGEDPYDAIGSMAFIAANLLAAVSLARVLLPHVVGRSGASIYVSRTQAAVSLCVVITVFADAAAMLRHLSQWWGTPGAPALLAILGSLLAASIAVLLVTCHRSQGPSFRGSATAGAVFLAALLCLWFYPESLIRNLLPHLFTCDLADVLLVAPVASFALALFPDQPSAPQHLARTSSGFGAIPRWSLVLLLGAAIDLAAFLAEIRESVASVPLARLASSALSTPGWGSPVCSSRMPFSASRLASKSPAPISTLDRAEAPIFTRAIITRQNLRR